MAVTADETDDDRAEKALDDLIAWRYRRARDLGLEREEARAFSRSGLPMAELRRMIERGCPPQTAARILL